jgi:hypothetical protein
MLEIVLQKTLLVGAALILPLISFSPNLDFQLARGRPSRDCEESDAQKPAYDPLHEDVSYSPDFCYCLKQFPGK